jgi:succinate-semialdehyde dehydrogenase/glutarate-semialdehyde dehydrogenase
MKILMNKNKQRYAELITAEIGRPLSSSIAEVEKCITHVEYYQQNTIKFLEDEVLESKYKEAYVIH